jgi:curved DNA-binding protein CbpA
MQSQGKKDYYEILDLDRSASREDIERAYQDLLGLYDYDSSGTYSLYEDDERDTILKEIHEAYLALINIESRKEYNDAVNGAESKVQSKGATLVLVSGRKNQLENPNLERNGGHQLVKETQTTLKKEQELHLQELLGQYAPERMNGQYLKKLRECSSLSIKDLSTQTRINTETLTMLESDDFLKLPVRVYVLGFVKLYLKTFTDDYERFSRDYIKFYDEFFSKRERPK